MRVEAPADRPAPAANPGTGRLLVTMAVVAMSVLGTFAATVRYLVPDPGEKILQWSRTRGHNLYRRVPMVKAFSQAPKLILRSTSELPHLVIDIKFKHMRKISAKREEALKRGQLIATDADLVPASMRFEKRTIPVKLRLKGDLLDHLGGRKWSFRVEVKGKDQILGMRRFSIQHPKVRGFQGETLVFEMMRRLGVITPRYFFVEVTVNGTKIGIMAIEEHFSKELLESNQRPEGVILRFDESLVWAARDGRSFGLRGVFDDYRNAPIRPFRASRISKSEKLSREYAVATGLLRGFVDGTLRASEVFDVGLLGRFLGVAECWGSRHTMRWNNVRFYMNPITVRLEPIAFDANIQRRGSPRWTVHQNEPLAAALMADRAVFTAYRETLDRLSTEILEGSFLQTLQAAEKRHLPALQKEFFFLRAFPYEELAARAERFRARGRGQQVEPPRIDVEQYPVLIHASLVTGAEGAYLELTNAVPHEVEIRSLDWLGEGGRPSIALTPLEELELPALLPPRVWGEVYQPLRIPYVPLAPPRGEQLPEQAGDPSLRVILNLPGRGELWQVIAKPAAAALLRHPIPVPTLDQTLAAHPFLRRDGQSHTLRVAAGSWRVAGSLVVPPGFGLDIAAGTTLRFAAAEGLIAHGPLRFEGTAEEPIVLEGAGGKGGDGSWQGIAVLQAGGRSHWRHVTVRNTTGIQRPGWALTGGTALYQSDVEMVDCLFEGNQAQDALNVMRSAYRLEHLRIVDSASGAYASPVAGEELDTGQINF